MRFFGGRRGSFGAVALIFAINATGSVINRGYGAINMESIAIDKGDIDFSLWKKLPVGLDNFSSRLNNKVASRSQFNRIAKPI